MQKICTLVFLDLGFLLFLCIMLSMHVQCDLKLAIATVIASVSLITFSPIDSENRRLDTNEKRTYKKSNSVLRDTDLGC